MIVVASHGGSGTDSLQIHGATGHVWIEPALLPVMLCSSTAAKTTDGEISGGGFVDNPGQFVFNVAHFVDRLLNREVPRSLRRGRSR